MNPYLIALRAALPYLLAIAVGFGAGWSLNGLNVTAAKNDRDTVSNKFDAYRIEQHRLTIEAADAAFKQRQEAANAWAQNLEKILADKGAYERCVSAGKCGPARRVCVAVSRPVAGAEAAAVSAAGRPDEASADAIPSDAGLATDCAVTTGQLNALQTDIEAQPGYLK